VDTLNQNIMEKPNEKVVLIGMGGHALVVIDALLASERTIAGYCDVAPKPSHAGELEYFGRESDDTSKAALLAHPFLVTIGDNALRRKISKALSGWGYKEAVPVVHPTASVGRGVSFGRGTQVQGGVFVNAKAVIGSGVILNTGCIIEHECVVEDFAHVAPGAVLAGNVKVRAGAFIGANATVIQGLTIGSNAIVGAGAVVLLDVPAGATVVGNPARII
jgi:sugar O-acyltransferase (sialic acid O-acetyltransferase NeuD family)